MGSNPGYLLKSFLLYQVIFKEHGKFYQILWSSHNIWTLKTHPNPFLPNGLTIFSQTIRMQWQKWTMDWITMTSEGSILWNFKLKRSSGLLMHPFNIFMRFCTSLPKKTTKHLKKRKGKIFRALIFWYFTDELISLLKIHKLCPIFFANLWLPTPPLQCTDVRFGSF